VPVRVKQGHPPPGIGDADAFMLDPSSFAGLLRIETGKDQVVLLFFEPEARAAMEGGPFEMRISLALIDGSDVVVRISPVSAQYDKNRWRIQVANGKL